MRHNHPIHTDAIKRVTVLLARVIGTRYMAMSA
jgi:hypothetical protein